MERRLRDEIARALWSDYCDGFRGPREDIQLPEEGRQRLMRIGRMKLYFSLFAELHRLTQEKARGSHWADLIETAIRSMMSQDWADLRRTMEKIKGME